MYLIRIEQVTVQYRKEIDGLRTVAVVPVILFHAGFDIFSGGFVGVDIFFVISGYLITSILINDIVAGQFSLLRFYERRARRILPALFFVMLCCIPFAWMWMFPIQFEDFSHSLIGVSLFVSNIFFWQESGYFAAAAEEKPLLHTWSLAVEEQYYVLFPLFLILAWRLGKRPVFWMIVLFAAISLGLSEWGWRNEPKANFFLAPTRAWELFAGSICAFLLHAQPQRSNNLLSAIGLTLILFSIFVYDSQTPFPSVYALAPAGGTMLIVLFADAKTWVARILSVGPMVGVGLISYSAYLWHQPLFAFARIRNLGDPHPAVMLVLAAAAIILAIASWKFIEQPFRKGGWPLSRKHIFAASAAMIALFCAYGYWGSTSHWFEQSFLAGLDSRQAKFAEYIRYSQSERHRRETQRGKCFLYSGATDFDLYDKDYCLRLDNERQNVLIIGDSHAGHLVGAVRAVYPDVNLIQATSSGCKPVIPFNGEPFCKQLHEYIFYDFVKNSEPLDGIILSARWALDDLPNLERTLGLLLENTSNVVVSGPTVEYRFELPLFLLREAEGNLNAEWHKLRSTGKYEIEEALRTVTLAAGAQYQSVLQTLCTPDRSDCVRVVEGEVPVAYDYGHFTLEGAVYAVNRMDVLRSALTLKGKRGLDPTFR